MNSFENVCRVVTESYVMKDDFLWLISREEFAVDTFVLRKMVEGRVINSHF